MDGRCLYSFYVFLCSPISGLLVGSFPVSKICTLSQTSGRVHAPKYWTRARTLLNSVWLVDTVQGAIFSDCDDFIDPSSFCVICCPLNVIFPSSKLLRGLDSKFLDTCSASQGRSLVPIPNQSSTFKTTIPSICPLFSLTSTHGSVFSFLMDNYPRWCSR